MSVSLYAASVPVFRQLLEGLKHVLSKAEAQAASGRVDAGALPGARLFHDMFPLSRQVQVACDFAKGACARLAGVEVPAHDNADASLADLAARVDKALAFLETLTQDQIEAGGRRLIVLKKGEDGFDQAGPAGEGGADARVSAPMRGDAYLLRFALPQFFFHVVTAYDILRHRGVDLGKGDYLGDFRRG